MAYLQHLGAPAQSPPSMQELTISFRVGQQCRTLHGRGIIRCITRILAMECFIFGIELETANGESDGTFNGRRYFTCAKDHATFTFASGPDQTRWAPHDHAAFDTELHDAQAQAKVWQERYEGADHVLKWRKREIYRLMDAHNTSQDDVQAQFEEIVSLRQECDLLQASKKDHDSVTKENIDLKAENRCLRTKHTSLESEALVQKAGLERAMQLTDARVQKLDGCQQQLQDLQWQMKTHKELHKALHTVHHSLQLEHRDLQLECNGRKQEKARLRKEQGRLRAERDRLQVSKDELEMSVVACKQELAKEKEKTTVDLGNIAFWLFIGSMMGVGFAITLMMLTGC